MTDQKEMLKSAIDRQKLAQEKAKQTSIVQRTGEGGDNRSTL